MKKAKQKAILSLFDGNEMNPFLITALILLVALILISAFFSASETAMMAINRYRLKHLTKKHHKKAMLTQRLLKRPDRLLGVILLGNTCSNLFASSLTAMIAGKFFGEIGVLLSTLALTAIILIFSELIPKTLAALYPEKMSFRFAKSLQILQFFLYPFAFFLNLLSNGLLKIFRVNLAPKHSEALSQEEIKSLVHDAKNKFQKRQHHMLLSVLDLETATTLDVLTPRSKIYALDLSDPLPKLLSQISESPYSKIPVYEHNLDHIKGTLSLKRLIKSLQQGPLTLKRLQAAIEPSSFVPEHMPLSKLLLQFQKSKEKLALVVNEYGDVEGLVTLEDILEEIVGDSLDSRLSPKNIEKLDNQRYRINGKASIREINREFDLSLPTDGAKTLAGFITEHVEELPEEKEWFSIFYSHSQGNESKKSIQLRIDTIENNLIRQVTLDLTSKS